MFFELTKPFYSTGANYLYFFEEILLDFKLSPPHVMPSAESTIIFSLLSACHLYTVETGFKIFQ